MLDNDQVHNNRERKTMIRNASAIYIILADFTLGVLWHLVMLFACIYMPAKTFDRNRWLYQKRKWELEGKLYSKYLKIGKWKDILPQRVGSDGFSKAHFTSTSKEYVDRFIFETCRGEWNHIMNCFYGIVPLVISPLKYGLVFTMLAIIGNVPFIAIQRYNRLRLIKLQEKLDKRREQ